MQNFIKLGLSATVLLFLSGCGSSDNDGEYIPPTNINCDKEAGEIGQACTTALGVKFNFIPQGSFMMGAPNSDTEAWGDEKPQHNVTLTKNF
ncbi:MAG: hypothetical protein LBS73_06165, partial [Campylobacteraceae bacterium]|nr:hypothetical protein [Campylobacteraceae bacterium]